MYGRGVYLSADGCWMLTRLTQEGEHEMAIGTCVSIWRLPFRVRFGHFDDPVPYHYPSCIADIHVPSAAESIDVDANCAGRRRGPDRRAPRPRVELWNSRLARLGVVSTRGTVGRRSTGVSAESHRGGNGGQTGCFNPADRHVSRHSNEGRISCAVNVLEVVPSHYS